MPRTILVGILNVTPDSFSDGGSYGSTEEAVAAGVAMVEEGADWIDVGGESTRPGAEPVPEAEERARVIPVIGELAARISSRARISIDTYKSGTAFAALQAGATIVNDVTGGLLDPELLSVAGEANATVVLGHLRGTPETMMEGIWFGDVVMEVGEELDARVWAARSAGCKEIYADPGIGFGKKLQHNLRLLADLPQLCDRLGVPVMVGPSRKGFIGELTQREPAHRAFGTAAAVAAAVKGGAAAVRVHDVAAMRDVLAVTEAIAAAAPDRA
jgi:dihydropteroate synthase